VETVKDSRKKGNHKEQNIMEGAKEFMQKSQHPPKIEQRVALLT
jgi:hypothetical protein